MERTSVVPALGGEVFRLYYDWPRLTRIRMTLLPGTRLGPYEILSALGRGGMGEVYRARDTRLGRTVAIKVLPRDVTANPHRRERFASEARTVAALSHPHICALYDFGTDNGIDHLVMEYLEGDTLADRLIAGPLVPSDVLRYAVEIADALDHAHRQDLIHGDLKPANVMVTKSGAKLLDFGLATAVPRATFVESAATSDSKATVESQTADLTLMGTLHYLAPEQLERQRADSRSDIFAFGTLVYEMATRQKVFDGESQARVIAAILSPEPPPIVERQPLLPPSLDRVVRKCLAKDPDERWQSAHDLKTALQWIGDAESRESGRWSTLPRANRREHVAWIVAGVLLFVSIIAIGFARRVDRTASSDAKPFRFLVAPAEDTTLFSGGGVMALSPDGRELVLVATPRGGKPLLWIRSLDAVAARPLLGTTDASQPFWSPDSQFVAFSAGGKLKKVEVATGQVQTLCDTGGTAGTWSASGEILFKSAGAGGIVRVPAKGGRPISVTELDSSRGEFSHNWPWFLPDGRHFLYLVWSTQPEFAGIYVGSLDGPDRRRMLSDYSQALYVPPGYVVFHRGSTIFAQRFDPVTFRLSGDTLPLAADVAFNPRTSRAVFSLSNNGVLAYRNAEDAVLGWFDRDGTVGGTLGLPGRDRDPAISPDGKTVAVSRLDPRTGTSNIWLIDSDRGATTRLTFDPHGDSAPTWSPDGTRLVFASQRSGGRFELYVRSSANGTVEEPLLGSSTTAIPSDAPMNGIPSDWSRYGQFVIFTRLGTNTHDEIWAFPLLGLRKPFAVGETRAAERLGQLSPDGRWLAYQSTETGTPEIYVRAFQGSTTAKWRVSNHGGVEPRWRRDGKELFYLGIDQRLMAAPVRTTATFEADSPVPLFETGTVSPIGTSLGITGRNQYDVAPDGQRFLINAAASGSSKPITIVVNWPATLSH